MATVAIDTSTFSAFIGGATGRDIEALDQALIAGEAALPPPVLAELLSDARLPAGHRKLILSLPLLPLPDGYWARVGGSRAALLAMKLRARLADTLIAQACIDNDVALISRDGDFRHFAKHCGLRLL